MPGNFDSNAEQSLMRIADQLAVLNKAIQAQNQLLRELIDSNKSAE